MKKAEAIRNVAVALGVTMEDIKRGAETIAQLSTSAEELTAHLKSVNDAMFQCSQSHKSYQSPYAKFDKFHHKRKKK